MNSEEKLEQQAIAYAKKHRSRIATELTNEETFPPDLRPVSVFMSGSPGAGKTETSKAFLEEIGADNVLRLDPDELRELIPGYAGNNSYLF